MRQIACSQIDYLSKEFCFFVNLSTRYTFLFSLLVKASLARPSFYFLSFLVCICAYLGNLMFIYASYLGVEKIGLRLLSYYLH